MGKSVSLAELSQFLTSNVDQIGQVHQEVEEIQVGFNSAYVEWKAQHDATLEQLVETVTTQLEEIGPDLRARIEEGIAGEQTLIDQRRQELEEKHIPETQAEADQALADGQEISDRVRQENPRLDQREEELKARRIGLEEELAQLNQQIRTLSGCLRVVVNFRKINKLDRQRHQVFGQLKVIHRDLRQVREEWQEIHKETQAQQQTLQVQWQQSTLELAQLQGELDYVSDEANRASLALRRAARRVLDGLKEPIAVPADDIEDKLSDMTGLNVQTDDYQEGLGSVAGLLALLDGIRDGLQRFDESVESIIAQQRMHSAHLPKLDVTIPDNVLAFHGQWEKLAQMVRDDGHLCAHPVEFLDLIQPVLAQDLSETEINTMFESLGQALKHATDRWG